MLRLPHLSERDPQDRLEGAEIRLSVLGSARTPFHSGSVSRLSQPGNAHRLHESANRVLMVESPGFAIDRYSRGRHAETRVLIVGCEPTIRGSADASFCARVMRHTRENSPECVACTRMTCGRGMPG